LAHRIGLDGEVALFVDKSRTICLEEGAGGIDVVAGLAETDAEGNAALLTGFRSLQEGVQVPVVGLWRAARRIHGLNVNAGVLLHQGDARAGALDLAAGAGG